MYGDLLLLLMVMRDEISPPTDLSTMPRLQKSRVCEAMNKIDFLYCKVQQVQR